MKQRYNILFIVTDQEYAQVGASPYGHRGTSSRRLCKRATATVTLYDGA